jgi:peroxidase
VLIILLQTSGGKVAWEVLTGRRDGLVSSAKAANRAIPRPTDTLATLKSKFAARRLSVQQMVALSGT